MEFKYESFTGDIITKELEEVKVEGMLLHATPDYNVESIKNTGLKVKMPKNKLMADIDAIFCTIPSAIPNTSDLFRYYDDWSVVVIDTTKIPDHKWYFDFLSSKDASNNGKSNHIFTFENIPPEAINKIVK